MRLRRLFRSLQGVDDEVTRYNAMLAKFLDAKEDEWEAIVAVYRGDLQKPFFEHMQVGETGWVLVCETVVWVCLGVWGYVVAASGVLFDLTVHVAVIVYCPISKPSQSICCNHLLAAVDASIHVHDSFVHFSGMHTGLHC